MLSCSLFLMSREVQMIIVHDWKLVLLIVSPVLEL